MPRFHYVSMVVLFLFLMPSIAVANGQVLPCTEQNVKDWILAQNALMQRFEEIDHDLSKSLLTNYGLIPNVMPRVDKLVELQEVRREFEGLPYPECAYDFFWATLVYLNRRIDCWTYSMHIRSGNNSLAATENLYRDFVLPALYEMETRSNVDYFLTVGEERPSDAPPMVMSRIGEIIVRESTAESVIGVDEFRLPNCSGTEPITIRRSISRSFSRKIKLLADANFEADFRIPIVNIEANLKTYFEIDESQTTITTYEVEVRAAPGSTVIYTVNWVTVSIQGLVEILAPSRTQFVEFQIPNSLQAIPLQPVQMPCQVENTPTPTFASPA